MKEVVYREFFVFVLEERPLSPRSKGVIVSKHVD
jgi:hypothetical protein